jgi:D-alanyl-D-alanine carboxypeptidase/D-alanyl-D-alanine-endopeptidase (penicillin-binding protein 4)
MNAARPGRLRCAAAPALVCVALVAASCGGSARPSVAPRPPEDPIARLRHDLDTLISDPLATRATWGLVVKATHNEDVLYDSNGRKLLLPASAMKLVTLAAAAERLGWDHTFTTTLLGAGAIDFGFLDGDLVVVGGADPSIDDWDGAATRLFQSWADRLKALGVRTIGGRLVGDDDDFEDRGLGAGWAWDDLSASYAASVGGLQFNQNTVRVMVTPGTAAGAAATATLVPEGSGLTLSASVVTADAASTPAIQARRLPGSRLLEVRGAVPVNGPPLFRNVSVDNPTEYFLDALQRTLVANGIEIRGGVFDIDETASPPRRADGVPLIVHQSPPLSVLAVTMMKNSQNLFAETVLREIGRDPAVTPPVTADAGSRQAQALLEGWVGGDIDLVLADGSGLSRYNLTTAHALVDILIHVARSDSLRGPFEAALPIAGVDGTLASRMKGTPAEGNARAKTGSFSNARALAGYVRSADGEQLAFAILANNFGGGADRVEQIMDAIVVRLAGFSRR